MIYRTFVFVFLARAAAQTRHWGPCPSAPAVEDFRPEDFEGKWFEIAKFPTKQEGDLTCCQSVISQKPDGDYLLQNSGKKGSLGYRTVVGSAQQTGNETAEFKVILSNSLPIPMPLAILDTDYDSYATAFICIDAKVFNFQYLWILSRQRTLSKDTMTHVEQKLNAFGIDLKALTMTEQVHC